MHFVDGLDHAEHGERDDDEVQNDGDQIAEVDGDLGVNDLAALHHGLLEHPFPRGEVHAAGKNGDKRHDNIVHQRGRDLAERAADDDTDGHVDDVAAHGKRLEFFHKLLHKKSPLSIFENK